MKKNTRKRHHDDDEAFVSHLDSHGVVNAGPDERRQRAVGELTLRDGAEVVFDMAKSEAAQIMARGGAQLTGKATIRLVCGQ